MSTAELLSRLRELRVRLWIEGGELKVSAPRGALTPELRARLGERKHEIVALLAPRQDGDAAEIPRANRNTPLPLSFSQQRLWFLEQLEPGNTAYNMWIAIVLRGELDRDALERSVAEIVRRHEVLRTSFPDEGGVPYQRIAPPGELRLELVEDQAGRSEEDWRAEVRRLLVERAQLLFDLAAGPLFLPTLVRVHEREHVLFLLTHHLVFDGLSKAVLVRELQALYPAFAAGRPSPLPELPIQYADYAAWQRAQLASERFGRTLAYWKATLGGHLPVLELPTDRPRSAVTTRRGAAEWLEVPGELIERVERLGKGEGATLFSTLLATYDVLIHRMTGLTDLLVGTAMANRDRAEVERLIGYFVNTIVLRADLSGDPSFRQVLRRVRDATLGALEHQDIPFEQLVDDLQPERRMGTTPLFQTMFVLDEDTGESRRMGSFELEHYNVGTRVARMELILSALRERQCFWIWAEYDTELFERATIVRLLDRFLTLLEAAVEEPDRPITELPLLPQRERRALLEGWSPAPSEVPLVTVHERFEAAVDRDPQATALVVPGDEAGPDEQLCYAELDARANRLAHHLIAAGAGPGQLIGLSLDRSTDLLVALLAILKTGAAYVPLDPEFPAERLAYMVADAGLRLIVTRAGLRGLLPGGPRKVALDEERSAVEARPSTRPGVAVDRRERMYVIYTSGSTGRPKGVEIEHRSVVNFLASMAREPGIRPGERFLALTTLSFDIAVLEILLPLTYGGTVVLVPRGVANEGDRLAAFVERARPDSMQATPATWRMLLFAGWKGDPRLRIFCGGEALTRELADELLARGAELWNLYGPTETTVWSTIARVRKDSGPIRIGRPIAETRAYVLDARMQLLPIGVPGELYLGGAGLARGYLNRPELTAERFVRDPFSSDPLARLYRTGDLARWVEIDGKSELECLGRTDHQVKLRGYRIELGEIESVVQEHASVHQSAAILREDQPLEKRIVAYVVRKTQRELSLDELRDHVAQRLPSYMVPTAFVELESLPLTANGKIDRRALAARPPELPAPASEYVAPRDGLEAEIARIWSAVLGVERVGVRDDFFELGGNSLLSTQVMARVRAAFEVKVALRELFEEPTVEALARKVRGAAPARALRIARASREGPLPLSFAQERLWFLDQLEPGRSTYNMWIARTLRGPLDERALERALAEIVRRHEVLRTAFGERDGVPFQVVSPPESFRLERLADPLGSTLEDRRAALRRTLLDRTREPFDLARGPLLRAWLSRVDDDEHVLFVLTHHTLFDGLSIAVFLRELSALYEAFAAGRPSPLSELEVQYVDYAVWQRALLRGEEFEREVGWWKEALGGELAALELPLDRPRPALQTYQGAVERRWISRELLDALQALAHREGATLFMVLLAAYKTLLHRLTSLEDVIVGTAVANRGSAALEALVGSFVNTLALRTDLSGDPSFRELLGRVRKTVLDALEHQETPFERLVDELAPKRNLSTTPIFQTMFVLDEDLGYAEQTGALSLEYFDLEMHSARTELTLFTYQGRDGLAVWAEYNTDLFDGSTIARFLACFETLLRGITTDADGALSRFAILIEPERRLLGEWSVAPRSGIEAANVLELVERQAQRTPDAEALVSASDGVERSLTYAELNRRANRVAHVLLARGVEPGGLVGLCVERTPDMVTALLGILKTGAAYVPLDPSFPSDRLAYMVEDARLSLIVTERGLEGRLPAGAKKLSLDEEREGLAGALATRPEVAVSPESLMYVIYTSGSTGRPKGVEIEHRSVVNFLSSMAVEPGMREGERLLAVTTLSFDIAVLEIVFPLTVGGTVVLAPREDASEGDRLAALVERVRPDAMQATPATWRMLLLAGWKGDGKIRILCGGEALTRELADALLDRGSELWNLYGPTETTVWSTIARIERERPITIGRPIGSTRVYVLDRNRQPVPIGVAGELYIGGTGLARGYLNRAELTAERFVADPFAAEGGARMYRTGDLARWRKDGSLECLGRTDQQVKVRGFRIELGEIEAVIGESAQVHMAAAVVREDQPGDKRIVAYYAAKLGASIDASELKEELSRRLPSYMVPSHLVELETLPLTPNGKIDRRALLALGPVEAAVETEYVAPRDPIEQRIAVIFAEVLGVERVGVRDDFFDLGGNSLLSTQAMARVREAFEVSIALRELFQEPTIEALARKVRSSSPAELRGIERVSREGPLPLSFAQERLWFLDQLEPGQSTYNMWIARTLRGALDERALERALSEIVRRHEVLRTTFGEKDGVPFQVVSPPESFGLERLGDPIGSTAEERRAALRRTLLDRAREPFDLARGPLFRAFLARVADEEHVLFVLTHHTVFDGLSIAVFLRELASLYEAFAAEKPSPLHELEVQYADYAVWQRSLLRGEEFEHELGWWKEELGGELAALELPLDRPRRAIQTYHGAVERRWIPRELLDVLQALAHREGATLFMVLLAAYQVLLRRLSGQHVVIVGTAVANRGRTELEGLLGLFVNTLALRTDLSGDPSFRECLRRVRKTVLDALEHQETPFERLVDEIAPKRNLSTTPIFQTMFVLDEDLGYAGRTGALSLEYFDLEVRVAHTDLTLFSYQGRDGLSLWAEYNTDLFDGSTIARFLACFQSLLGSIAGDSERVLSELQLLDPDERQRLLVEWNATRSGYPRRATIQEVFEAQVARSPDALAAVFIPSESGEAPIRLTYRELNERANRLAHHLRSLGVQPDQLVGLCAERSLPMLVGILGILKSGGAYLPLDPGYPEERLAFMMEDAGLSILLVQKAFDPALPAFGGEKIVLDAEPSPFAGASSSNPPTISGPRDLAYVMFTSGSTGRPKGVMVEQRSVLRLVMDPNFACLGSDEVVLHFAPISFDASTLEVWGALLRGGTMVVYPPTQPSLEELGAVIREHGVTTAWLTAGLFSLMVDQRLEDLRGLRRLLAGGDVLPVPQVNRMLENLPGVRLINGYGPTENTTFTCCYTLPARERVNGSVPIGCPVSDTQVYVLDERFEPVPIGVFGELYIAGDGLARGYLNRPELDAEKFVPNPFAGEPGAKMYRTGDLVRWKSDRTIEFQGRRDHQVKVRGFRIELGEIEAVLGNASGVRESAVIVREDQPGDKRIVAYVVAQGRPVPEASALRQFLRRKLPDYMVPAHFVFLEALPLSPNGKVDRKRLPAPDPTSSLESEYAPPRNEIERRIAEIWQEVLGVERVGIHDNFFELGGNSLLSTQTVSRIRTAFGVELPLRDLFQDPTVAGLARPIIGRQAGEIAERRYDSVFDASLIPLQPRGWKTPLFLVSGAHLHEDDFLRFVGSILPYMGLDQPIYGFKARGLDGVQPPHASAEEMAADYIHEMRELQPHGPYLLAGNCVGGIVAYEMAQQLRRAGEQVALVALLDTSCPLDDYRAFVDHYFRFWKLERFVGHWRRMNELSGGHKLRYVFEKLGKKARQLLPMSEKQQRKNHVERVQREYSVILARYRPLPYEGKVTLVINEELQALTPDAGWRPFCVGGLETHVVAGDHVTRLSLNARVSADILKRCIDEALAERGSREGAVRIAAG